MNESTFTRNINKGVHELDPSVVAWKLSDRFNSGRPDCHYLKQRPLYVEYKFARVSALPSRHTPTISPLQAKELRALHTLLPEHTKVIVGFEIKNTRGLTFVEFSSPAEWENSTPIAGLPTYAGHRQVAQRILFLIS